MADPRIPTGPIHREPGPLFLPEAERQRLLDQVLDGVILGTYDHRIVAWMTSHLDTTTMLTVASLILRARHTEAAQLAADLAGLQKRGQS